MVPDRQRSRSDRGGIGVESLRRPLPDRRAARSDDSRGTTHRFAGNEKARHSMRKLLLILVFDSPLLAQPIVGPELATPPLLAQLPGDLHDPVADYQLGLSAA